MTGHGLLLPINKTPTNSGPVSMEWSCPSDQSISQASIKASRCTLSKLLSDIKRKPNSSTSSDNSQNSKNTANCGNDPDVDELQSILVNVSNMLMPIAQKLASTILLLAHPIRLYYKISKDNIPDDLRLPKDIITEINSALNCFDSFGLMFLTKMVRFHNIENIENIDDTYTNQQLTNHAKMTEFIMNAGININNEELQNYFIKIITSNNLFNTYINSEINKNLKDYAEDDKVSPYLDDFKQDIIKKLAGIINGYVLAFNKKYKGETATNWLNKIIKDNKDNIQVTNLIKEWLSMPFNHQGGKKKTNNKTNKSKPAPKPKTTKPKTTKPKKL